MSRLALIVVLFTAFALPASAQTGKPSTASQGATQTAPAAKKATPARPGGKGGARVAQPLSSNLTASECRKLGGKTETETRERTCKYGMRCTIIHANGDVYSSCIDELE